VYENIVWCHSENNAPHPLKNVSFVKDVREFDNSEHLPTFIVLDDLKDSPYSSKGSDLFTKGSHHRYMGLIMITHNLFHQGPSSRDISLNSKYIAEFKNPRDKNPIVHLARQVYHKIFLAFTRRIGRL
jgi:hypothetical protein